MAVLPEIWGVVEHIRVVSGMAELAIFTALIYWFFTSSRVADMLEVVGERVGGWCGREEHGASSLRRLAQHQRRRQHTDLYTKIENSRALRATSLYRMKEGSVAPVPSPPPRPPVGLACSRCAPLSRESWQDQKTANSQSDAVINVLDIGRQTYANGGVISRYFCDLVQSINLQRYTFPDVVDQVVQDERFQRAIEDKTQEELRNLKKDGKSEASVKYAEVRRIVEAKAMKVLRDISSTMSTAVLRFVAWLTTKAIRRVAGNGCSTRVASIERLKRAKAAGLPLIFVPLHRSHLDYILVTYTLYLTGLRPPLVAAGDNMRIPLFGWFLRGCGAFYIRRRQEGSDIHEDPVYKSALRTYILKSLKENNNLEFFIEGGRTRTGKPQLPKAGILSVIMEAYLDGTIEDALLVPVTLNYDKLVDGNFVREQLGMPKQMETFWSAFKGIWRMMNTNYGGIRVHLNQPISLKELATSFQKYQFLRASEMNRVPPNNNLAINLDRKMLLKHSNSSLYGADVSAEHKMMVEAIGRHIVYDAASATAIMCTNVLSYILLTEARRGVSAADLYAAAEARTLALRSAGRALGYTADTKHLLQYAIDLLGRSLVRTDTVGDKTLVRPVLSIPSSLELSYYANTLTNYYATEAIVVTAIETILQQKNRSSTEIRHSELMELSVQLCELMSEEFVLCPPCQRVDDLVAECIDNLLSQEIITRIGMDSGLDETRWAQRFAKTLEDEDEALDPTMNIRYNVGTEPHIVAERRRLLLTLRPLLEAYSVTCKSVQTMPLKALVKLTLDNLANNFTQGTMPYGEAVSTDAIRNCLQLLRTWGVIDIYTETKQRQVRVNPPYETNINMDNVCQNILKFKVDTPLLNDV